MAEVAANRDSRHRAWLAVLRLLGLAALLISIFATGRRAGGLALVVVGGKAYVGVLATAGCDGDGNQTASEPCWGTGDEAATAHTWLLVTHVVAAVLVLAAGYGTLITKRPLKYNHKSRLLSFLAMSAVIVLAVGLVLVLNKTGWDTLSPGAALPLGATAIEVVAFGIMLTIWAAAPSQRREDDRGIFQPSVAEEARRRRANGFWDAQPQDAPGREGADGASAEKAAAGRASDPSIDATRVYGANADRLTLGQVVRAPTARRRPKRDGFATTVARTLTGRRTRHARNEDAESEVAPRPAHLDRPMSDDLEALSPVQVQADDGETVYKRIAEMFRPPSMVSTVDAQRPDTQAPSMAASSRAQPAPVAPATTVLSRARPAHLGGVKDALAPAEPPSESMKERIPRWLKDRDPTKREPILVPAAERKPSPAKPAPAVPNTAAAPPPGPAKPTPAAPHAAAAAPSPASQPAWLRPSRPAAAPAPIQPRADTKRQAPAWLKPKEAPKAKTPIMVPGRPKPAAPAPRRPPTALARNGAAGKRSSARPRPPPVPPAPRDAPHQEVADPASPLERLFAPLARRKDAHAAAPTVASSAVAPSPQPGPTFGEKAQGGVRAVGAALGRFGQRVKETVSRPDDSPPASASPADDGAEPQRSPLSRLTERFKREPSEHADEPAPSPIARLMPAFLRRDSDEAATTAPSARSRPAPSRATERAPTRFTAPPTVAKTRAAASARTTRTDATTTRTAAPTRRTAGHTRTRSPTTVLTAQTRATLPTVAASSRR